MVERSSEGDSGWRWSSAAVLACVAWAGLAASCTEAGLQAEPPPVPPPLDNLLTIEGEFCTEPNAEVTFPVKVLYIIDQSASLQCTDSQNRRFAALNRSIDELRQAPNTSFAFIGFSSWSRELGFTRNRDEMAPFLDPAAGQGPATDYQGALATAIRLIERDILATDGPTRARSRYLVVFVSDGNPEPRCLPGCEDTISNCSDGMDNDGDGLLDGTDGDCANINDNGLHPDNLYGVCNTDEEIPDDVYVDMTGICPEYNQPTQIARRIQELVGLKEAYNVGDVSLHSVLLFSPQAVVEGVCPGAGTAFGYVREQAAAVLQVMADAGNGTFRDVNVANDDDSFLRFDIATLEAEQTLYNMVAENEHGRRLGRVLGTDMDRDGLSDEQEIGDGTDRARRDTDGDMYSDLVERRLAREGFDPLNVAAPAIPCGSDRDGDGDGLLDCEEIQLGTGLTQPDTDGDHITDRLELVMGTDPASADALFDLDFDGVFNGDEIQGGTNPLIPDEDIFRADRALYGLEDLGFTDVMNLERGELEQRRCYDFTVRRLQLVVTPLPADRGLNRILLYAFEGPAQISGIPGEVKVACFEAFYNGGDHKDPASGRIDVHQEALDLERAQLNAEVTASLDCPYFAAGDRSLGRFEAMMTECMPPKIQIGRQLFSQEEVTAMLRRHLRGDMSARIPERAFELFRPIQNFSPNEGCYRPWEYPRLKEFLAYARQTCLECVGAEEEPMMDGGEGP